MARAAVIPQSPAKRASRPRGRPAAAASTAAARAKAKTATTAPATTTIASKAATGVRKGTVARTASRGAVDDDETDEDELGVIENEKAKPVRGKGKASTTTAGSTGTAGRGRKPAARSATPESESDDDDELAQVDVPKKRVGRPRAKPQEQIGAAPKPRGRPKGSTNAKSTTTKSVTGMEATNPKQVAISEAALRSNLLRGPAKKKTVTFQDESGSEGEEDEGEQIAAAPTGGRKKATAASSRQTGRKMAGTGRGQKPVAPKSPVKPLSPKKANQVTKSLSSYAGSDGEEDELIAEKGPIRLTAQSPTKHSSAKTGLSSPVKRINLTPGRTFKSVDENGNPVRRSIDFNDITSMSSPAREPSPSPFHYTMRETPRRIGFELRDSTHTKPIGQPDFSAPSQGSPLKASPRKAPVETPRGRPFGLRDDLKPVAQPNFTPGETSTLKSSPKKGLFGTPRASTMAPFDGTKPLVQPSFTPAQTSPLKTSPKKGNLAASFSQSAMRSSMKSSTPSFNPRISLLQSPAKKTATPFKSSMTPMKTALVEQQGSTTPREESVAAAGLPTPKAEEPLMRHDLHGMDQDQSQEDSEDELSMDYQHDDDDAPAQPEDHMEFGEEEEREDDMDEVAVVGDAAHAEHEITTGEDHAVPAYDAGYAEEPVHEAQEHNVEESSLDLGEELAETFDVKETEDQGYVDNNRVEETVRNLEAEIDEEDVDNLVQGVLQDFVDYVGEPVKDQEPAEEPGNEDQVQHQDIEPEMQSEEPFQVSDHEDEVEPEVAHQEEIPQQDIPENIDHVDDVESAREDSEVDELANEEFDQVSIHQSEEESDDGSDEQDFGFDDGTTLVGIDVNQRYMSPQRRTEAQRGLTFEREVRDVAIQVPSSPIVGDDHYRDGIKERMTSDGDAQSEQHPMQRSINRPEAPSLPEPSVLDQRAPEHRSIFENAPRFTPLGQQFSEWKTGSEERRPRRSLFSFGGAPRRPSGRMSASSEVSYPDLSRQSISSSRQSPLAEVATQDVEDESMEPAGEDQPEAEPETLDDDALKPHEAPKQPEIFTDPENETPEAGEHGIPHASVPDSIPVQDASPAPAVAPAVNNESDDEKENENIPAPAPAPATPMKNRINPPQTFHTVSKVPLKPEGDVSPLKMSRKRGRSLSNVSPSRASPRLRRSFLLSREEENVPTYSPRKSPRMESPTRRPQRWSSTHSRANSVERRQSLSKPTKMPSRSPSPAKSPRKSIGGNGQALQGAVVYVDVHTTEGEDASGIFIELLQQMGARCVKNWSWNPRASVMPEEGTDQKDGKVGITHVVYKDGGVRTLEKVRSARGLVKCVGVGWVLDCERENKWVEEAPYAVDSSIIPRGGAKRRKSMEPRALSNINGTLVKTDPTAADRRRSGVTPPISFPSRSGTESSEPPQTPTSSRKYNPAHTEADQNYTQTPRTPGYRFNMDDYMGMSPTTPFYLSRAKIVQQTCPPKQTNQGLFPVSSSAVKARSRGELDGGDDVEGSKALRLKLEAARRKSLAFKPSRGSPLIE